MRKILLVGIALLVSISLFGLAWSDDSKKEEKDKGIARCPKTQMTDQKQCLDCHVKYSFKVPKVPFDFDFLYPNNSMKIHKDGEKLIGYYYFTTIAPIELKESMEYFIQKGIKHVIIEIHSPGGGLFDAWRCIGLIGYWKSKGMVIETRSHGLAASAGFLVFVSGSKGYRLVSQTAEFMWHELRTGDYFKISTPSSTEDEALVLRHLQNTAQNWLASRSNMKKEDLDEKIRKKEFWVNGAEMIKMGFADGLLN